MKTTFGEYIRELRKKRELTLTQLAAKLNLDSANLSKIENDKREFDERRLPALANIFDLNLDDLTTEYLSDKIAKNIYLSAQSNEVLLVAEQKIEYRRNLSTQKESVS